ncbi:MULTISPECIES: 1-deoxy-D-xylulose-5-phosphate synthase [Atopobiaceae]|uniref:1-deoxy-D-xylulose-5-phosphate synthase n=1 Tax=Parafannyhessea umbonata TaxID=604330 RepID=A0A1H6IPH5_9ACTN|nr:MULTISPECIES: 1-deoxy-D-xylulose-5-phosphate synthase [Atopobiaceae]SEH48497.1 1-deoxy-D-xylulose-5-phosphate synthase [Parafannyhessea umbonata]SJZ67267.1 1-deoxy-D-xylulose-5-phosphate synthase [Olsenella sp. KH1P3]
MSKYLDSIDSPADLKRIPQSELPELAKEIRSALIRRLEAVGGHFGSNLGAVELEIALHYVFDSPRDKFVFDVSHQSYTHKVLTGRRGMVEPETYLDYSGFSAPEESVHDQFKVGHTSTSLSLACGLAKARDLTGGKGNVVAVIGDGSMSGGEAFEGLNNAAMLDSNMIILFNDNDMSIAPNQGGMYRNFAELRATKGTASNNFFTAMGLEYRFLESGNDLDALIQELRAVKDIDHPIVVHICTQKGLGSDWAQEHREEGHWVDPKGAEPSDEESPTKLNADFLLKKIQADPSVVVINAGTPGGLSLTPAWRAKAGKQFVDVGIAEEHAVAFTSGLARGGAKPVYLVSGSFAQRTYDQLMQDLALNRSAGVILVRGASIGTGDATHNGTYISSLENIVPNVRVFSPSSMEDEYAILDWAIDQQEGPVIINVPESATHGPQRFSTEDVERNRVVRMGRDVALMGYGNFQALAQEVATELEKCDIDATVIDPVFANDIDAELLQALKGDHRLVVTLEDGMLAGGFGSAVTAFYSADDMRVLNYGARREYLDRVDGEAMRKRYHLNPETIAQEIREVLER